MPLWFDLKTRLHHRPATLLLPASLAGVGLGLVLAAVGSATRAPVDVPALIGIDSVALADPLVRLSRTSMALAAVTARNHLEEGRPWAAWEALQEHVWRPEDLPATAALTAARAASAWGGWDHVRRLLRNQPWLDKAEDGEGWWLLGQAEEQGGRWDRAEVAYRRYAKATRGRARGLAQARLAKVLLRVGRTGEAAAAFGAAATGVPDVADWLVARQAEALSAARVNPADASAPLPANAGSAARLRWVRAEGVRWARAGNVARAAAEAEREAPLLEPGDAAELALHRADWLIKLERTSEARELLRAAAAGGRAPAKIRSAAARRLGEIAGALTAAEEWARAAAFEAAARPGLAAKSLRGALRAGGTEDPDVRLRIGLLLYQERDFGPARTALLEAVQQLPDGEQAARAELYAAQSLYGKADARAAELRRLVERRPGTAAAGTALFLLGDVDPALRGSLRYYLAAAEIEQGPDAREALFRVGDRSLRIKDTDAAIRAWERYVKRHPAGEQTAEAAYMTGMLHEAARRESAARAMYAAAVAADPVSYYALRAAERLGVDVLARALAAPRPWIGVASEPAEAQSVLARMDALRQAGLVDEAEVELASAETRFADRPVALLGLAEGLAERGHPVDAIRIGRVLLQQRGGLWDIRLLRVVFPLPMRSSLLAEADRAGVDPMLLAGLVRQESSFRPDAKSRVGATGLAQLMPGTARMLARAADVHDWEGRLLVVPEVNLRMGALYLRDMLRRYDGARDLALAGYNAGPGRADLWKSALDYEDGPDAFRERIPFAETREYVKVVLRNEAVYQRLYGQDRSPALVSGK